MKNFIPSAVVVLASCLSILPAFAGLATTEKQSATFEPNSRFIQVRATTKQERSAIAALGVSIEFTRSDSVWGFAMPGMVKALTKKGFKVLGDFDREVARGGHEGILDFPGKDSAYHNLEETDAMLSGFERDNPELVKRFVVGKTIEGRDMWAVHVNTTPSELASGNSAKPGFILMGEHHAREHLSAEVPLLYLDYLLKNKNDPKVKALLDGRDLWVIPIVNPDGKQYDIATGRYQMWRKNRRENGDGTYGVDLNRNYGYRWGGEGASTNTSSETFMGPSAFSEPETQAIRDFVRAKKNTKVLLSLHTFSELVLYPWGYTYDSISAAKDQEIFSAMATTCAQWNGYTPQQSSDLYIVSGDTSDWAYGELGIYAFTFELSPTSMFGGGFYPGPQMIDKAFRANLQPMLYMLEMAGDPASSITDPRRPKARAASPLAVLPSAENMNEAPARPFFSGFGSTAPAVAY